MKKLRNFMSLFSTQLNYDRSQFVVSANRTLQQ